MVVPVPLCLRERNIRTCANDERERRIRRSNVRSGHGVVGVRGMGIPQRRLMGDLECSLQRGRSCGVNGPPEGGTPNQAARFGVHVSAMAMNYER